MFVVLSCVCALSYRFVLEAEHIKWTLLCIQPCSSCAKRGNQKSVLCVYACQVQPSALEVLLLRRCHLGPDSGRHLGNLLAVHQKLKILDLGDNKKFGPEVRQSLLVMLNRWCFRAGSHLFLILQCPLTYRSASPSHPCFIVHHHFHTAGC